MPFDLPTKIARCPLCDFDFMAPTHGTKKPGFGKETSLQDSRKFVQLAHELMGYSVQVPPRPYCPQCWFGVTHILPRMPSVPVG